MIERRGNLWRESGWKLIPTGGVLQMSKIGPRLVMGEGFAAEALLQYPDIDKVWGERICRHGNMPYPINEKLLINFPVRHQNYGSLDLALIRASSQWVASWACRTDPDEIFVPMMGGRSWRQVRPLLEGILDDRFVVLSQV